MSIRLSGTRCNTILFDKVQMSTKKLLTNSIVSLSIKCKLLSLGMSIRLSGTRCNTILFDKVQMSTKKLLTNSIVSLSIKCKLLILGMSIRLSGTRCNTILFDKVQMSTKKLLTNSIVSLSIKCKLLILGMSIRLSGTRCNRCYAGVSGAPLVSETFIILNIKEYCPLAGFTRRGWTKRWYSPKITCMSYRSRYPSLPRGGLIFIIQSHRS
ncbi:hypothetical protein J6590_068295 [Homalodisca vitripennis]|nr:hypothetical protein J6590_068295 [Homalodisca vitripennis]